MSHISNIWLQTREEEKAAIESLGLLAMAISGFRARTPEDTVSLASQVLTAMAPLAQERRDHILRHEIPSWPQGKYTALKRAAQRTGEAQALLAGIRSWPPMAYPPYEELTRIEHEFSRIVEEVQRLEECEELEGEGLAGQGLLVDWGVLNKVKQTSIRFGHRYCTIALAAYNHHIGTSGEGAPVTPKVHAALKHAHQFTYQRLSPYAGGFDHQTKTQFGEVNAVLQKLAEKAKTGNKNQAPS